MVLEFGFRDHGCRHDSLLFSEIGFRFGVKGLGFPQKSDLIWIE